MNVVSASELLAAAEASGAGGGQPIAYKHDDLAYDMGLLAAFDAHPLDPAALAADKEAALARAAADATQLLVRRVWELPVEKTDVGPVALLPPRSTKLPRTQPPPGPKPLTRWQKFAKERGIEKQKRSRLGFDEPTGEWKPRWGKERAKDGTADWLIPVKQAPGKKRARDDAGAADPMDEGEDEFSKRDLAKKDRVLKNSLSQLKNIQRATKASGGGSSSAASAALASLTGGGGGADGGAKKSNKKARRGGDGDEPVVVSAGSGKRVFTFEGGGAAARATDSAAALVAPRVRAVDVAPKGRAAHGDRSSGGKSKAGGKKGVSFAPSTTGGGGSSVPVGLPPIAGGSSGEGRVDTPFGAGKAMGKRVLVKEGRDVKAARLKLAQGSTASMGRVRIVAWRGAGAPALVQSSDTRH
jgi:hypothetical protein